MARDVGRAFGVVGEGRVAAWLDQRVQDREAYWGGRGVWGAKQEADCVKRLGSEGNHALLPVPLSRTAEP